MIQTLDSGYLGRKEFAAVYAIQSQGEWAIVDAATMPTAPAILDQLARAGALPEQVRYLILTHVHLDHSGGAAALLAHFPHATVLAHARALRHLSDPSRLIQSASSVYGVEKFQQLYGTIEAISPSRIRTVSEGESVDLGSGQWRFFETPGHAKHHISALWEEQGALFSGDALGLRYPRLGGFVCASTSPTDFDPQAALQEVERARHMGLRAIYPTHFGRVTDVATHLDRLERSLHTSHRIAREELTRSAVDMQERVKRIKTHLKESTAQEVSSLQLTWGAQEWEWLDLDLDLNAQGLAHWVKVQPSQSEEKHHGV